jgi:hypothetical protein
MLRMTHAHTYGLHALLLIHWHFGNFGYYIH